MVSSKAFPARGVLAAASAIKAGDASICAGKFDFIFIPLLAAAQTHTQLS